MIHQRLSTAFATGDQLEAPANSVCRHDLRSPMQMAIGAINRALGTDFDANDGLLLEQWMADLAGDHGLVARACAKEPDGFRLAFGPLARAALARRRQRNADLLGALASADRPTETVIDLLCREFQINAQHRGA